MTNLNQSLSEAELASFKRDGFVVIKKLASTQICDEMCAIAQSHLGQHLAPIEYEVDVQYPGAPKTVDEEGGKTTRRLLHAYIRHELFRNWSTSPQIASHLDNLFMSRHNRLSQCHHNCVMTKQPGYSSATLWHQDNRYWHFDEENLISVWLALGAETKKNGCLRVIPGTHELELSPGRFDANLFLRPDLAENKALIAKAIKVELEKGDVLCFHSKLVHAAGRNLSDETKFSVVFTYHQGRNEPIVGTRSNRFPSVELNT